MSQISKDKVVQFFYTLSDADGNQIETNRETNPMAYLHGHNGMLAAIEAELEGKSVGDSFSLTLPPDQAHGERQPDSEIRVPLKHLQGLPKGQRSWKPGMVAVVKTEQGMRQVTVVKPGLKMVTIDTNHPLAGQTLGYEIEVVDVRDATATEVAHGHAHGVGGHQH